MKELMDISELSEYLGMKKSSLYTKVANRKIPFYRIDRVIRFKKSEIDLWLKSLHQEPVDVAKVSKNIFKRITNNVGDVNSLVEKSIVAEKELGV